MAQTLFCVYLHIVFSTKDRFPFISPEIEEELYAYIGGIFNNHDCKLIAANGTPNHSHLLTSTGKHVKIPDLIGDVKRDSSKWLKTKGTRFSKFAWQDGYSVFSVGHTQIDEVKRYIAKQKSHHERTPFENEMRAFYRKYDLEFDEQYVWG